MTMINVINVLAISTDLLVYAKVTMRTGANGASVMKFSSKESKQQAV